jgi:hypothetical protein
MSLKVLLTVAIRLFALFWLVNGISRLAALVPLILVLNKQVTEGASQLHEFTGRGLVYLWDPGIVLGIALVLWFGASKIAAAVARHDIVLETAISLKREDVCELGLILLGVYFALSCLPGFVTDGLKFFGYDFSIWKYDDKGGQFVRYFLGHLVSLAAAFGCIRFARRWGAKLVERDPDQ